MDTLVSSATCDLTRNFSLVEVHGGDISMNKGSKGGGIYLSGAIFRGAELIISRNSAASQGGGIYANSNTCRDSLIFLEYCSISENKASSGGGIYLRSAKYSKDASSDVSGVHAARLPESINQIVAVATSLFTAYSPTSNSIFGDTHLQAVVAPLNSAVLVDCVLSRNFARQSGGGIFVAYEDKLCVCCSNVCSTFCSGNSTVNQLEACPKTWEGNRLGRRGYGPKIASSEVVASIFTAAKVRVENGAILEEAHNSGGPLPAFAVEVSDAFGQIVTMDNSNIFAFVYSDKGRLSGKVGAEVRALA